MIVIVCGSRDYTREATINAWLDGLYERYGDDLKIKQGGAKGADKIAKDWCRKKWGAKLWDHMIEYPADWTLYGKAAGMVRNKQMYEDTETDLVLAFKDDFNWKLDSGGTENMVKIAKEGKTPTFVVQKA